MPRHDWTHIILHHSATADSSTYSWEAIKRYHTQTLHWTDIGYHYGIEQVGTDFASLLGRPIHKSGAHCKQAGMNHKGIGLCFVGNYDTIPPSTKMLTQAARTIIIPLMHQYNIPLANIQPHSAYATYKSCPGMSFPLAHLKTIIGDNYNA